MTNVDFQYFFMSKKYVGVQIYFSSHNFSVECNIFDTDVKENNIFNLGFSAHCVEKYLGIYFFCSC